MADPRPCKHATHEVPVCPRCTSNRERAARWKAANPERKKENDKKRRASDPAKYSKQKLRWQRRNKKRRKEIVRAYRLRNLAKLRHKDRLRQYADRGVTVFDASVSIEMLFSVEDGICWRCGDDVPHPEAPSNWWTKATIDHVVPISEGGQHTADNCRLAHQACNVNRYNEERRKSLQQEPDDVPF